MALSGTSLVGGPYGYTGYTVRPPLWHETVNMVVAMCIDDLVQSVSLHIPRQFLLHGYILPFLTLYGGWLYAWFFIYGIEEYYEAGLIGVAVIGLLQILSCLCCHWSVHVQCFLTCKSVSRI